MVLQATRYYRRNEQGRTQGIFSGGGGQLGEKSVTMPFISSIYNCPLSPAMYGPANEYKLLSKSTRTKICYMITTAL